MPDQLVRPMPACLRALLVGVLALLAAVSLGAAPAEASKAGGTPRPPTTTLLSAPSVTRSEVRAPDLARAAAVLRLAASLRGIPYAAGGTTTSGFDCSGYTGYVFAGAGLGLPRSSAQQYAAATKVDRAAVLPGDLIFFRDGGGRVYHVAIYAGGGRIWHSQRTGTTVNLTPIYSASWVAGRVL